MAGLTTNSWHIWEAIVQQSLRYENTSREMLLMEYTNEELHLEEFIRANYEYPGNWNCEVEGIEEIAVKSVFSTDS